MNVKKKTFPPLTQLYGQRWNVKTAAAFQFSVVPYGNCYRFAAIQKE